MIDRLELAQLWQSILRTDPNRLFGRDADILMDRSDTGDDLPQSGFVGASDSKDLDNEIQHIRALRGLKAEGGTTLSGLLRERKRSVKTS